MRRDRPPEFMISPEQLSCLKKKLEDPDIELDPMTVDAQEMDLTVDSGMLKERDLSRSLSNARAHEGQQDVVVRPMR